MIQMSGGELVKRLWVITDSVRIVIRGDKADADGTKYNPADIDEQGLR